MISLNLFSLSLLAGALATFNACGFVLLPAYLTSLIISDDAQEHQAMSYIRAIRFSLGMTTGFIGVFGAFALFITPIAGTVVKYLPIITIIVGIALVALAISLISGKNLVFKKLANPNIAPNQNWFSQVGYGITFALASLSCTVGPFLAVTATAISTKSVIKTILLFASYALGMGIVVLTLALAVVAAKSKLIHRIKRSQRWIPRLSSVFLLAVGVYEIWYGFFEIRASRGQASSGPVTSVVLRLQSKIAQTVATLGTPFLVGSLILMTSLLVFKRYRIRRKA